MHGSIVTYLGVITLLKENKSLSRSTDVSFPLLYSNADIATISACWVAYDLTFGGFPVRFLSGSCGYAPLR